MQTRTLTVALRAYKSIGPFSFPWGWNNNYTVVLTKKIDISDDDEKAASISGAVMYWEKVSSYEKRNIHYRAVSITIF